MEDVGPKLRQTRVAQGLSLTSVAELAGVTKGFLSLAERGKTRVSVPVLLKICDVLGVAIGFTLNASAFLGEIWRGAIQAVPAGQSEAATALGVRYPAQMRHVVLPQAFRIAQPATVGYLVQLIKGTSLAAIVGFIELARAGQIVSNQTYQPILVFGVVGAIYFVLCWPLSLYSARLETRFAANAR